MNTDEMMEMKDLRGRPDHAGIEQTLPVMETLTWFLTTNTGSELRVTVEDSEVVARLGRHTARSGSLTLALRRIAQKVERAATAHAYRD